MNELISIIINVYNGEKFIAKCLDSIINQTYKNLEILIINDGSTDNTLSICQSYKDERIRIITTENFGLSKSRNIGIENAKGDYFYFIDVDDFVENDVIEYLYTLCKKYNTKISTCKPIDIYNYNVKIKNKKEKVEVISNYEMLKKVLLSEDRAVCIWNKLIKREIFNNIRFEDRIINDITVTYKLVLLADKIAYSNQIKYYYLRHKASTTISKKHDANRLIDKYNVCFERYNYLRNIYGDFTENNIGMLRIIPMLYVDGDKKLRDYLDSKSAIELFKKLFSFKILTCKLKFGEKIKIILFRINPKLDSIIYIKYQKMKSNKKG